MNIPSNLRSVLISFAWGCLLALSGCASTHTDFAGTGDLKNYKRAYVETLARDEFQIYAALFFELTDMGKEVVAVPFKEPRDGDLLVKYTYGGGWDHLRARYLQSFQFQFIDAKTGRVMVVQSFKSRDSWHGVRDQRLKVAFDELRARNGYPPTKQFR